MDDKVAERMDVAAPEAAPATATPGSSIPAEELEQLTADIVAALKTVYDPEIPADIYELGLIYKIDIDDDRNVAIEMTLTAPGCPVAGSLPVEVEKRIEIIPDVPSAVVELVWDPPWSRERMSEAAQLELGLM